MGTRATALFISLYSGAKRIYENTVKNKVKIQIIAVSPHYVNKVNKTQRDDKC